MILNVNMRKDKEKNFFDLSSAEQKKILKNAGIKANKDQAELVRKYEKLKVRGC